jgi:cytochrome c-type biogenesis protein CcmH
VLGALVLLASALLAAQTVEDPRQVVGPPRGKPLVGAALEARTKDVASLLRCPVCQGLSVADSPSSTAQNMKAHVRELLAEGYEQDQVLAYFERSYGEFVRLEPARRGVNWLVWIAPLAGLALGVGVVVLALRPPKAAAPAPPSEPAAPPGAAGADPLPEDEPLAEYVRKVRALAYGWPDGVRPGREPS